jgi:hypothetical protein
MKRLTLIIPALFAVAACSGRIATPAGQECSETLRLAEKEYEAAKVDTFTGSLEMLKAANLMSQASVARQFEKFASCTDKARRARIYIQEARKK